MSHSSWVLSINTPRRSKDMWIQQSESQHLTAVRMNKTGGGEDGHLLQPPLSLAINVMGEEDGGWILISSPVSTAPSPSNGAAHVPEMQKSLVCGTEYKLTLINLISTIPTKLSFFFFLQTVLPIQYINKKKCTKLLAKFLNFTATMSNVFHSNEKSLCLNCWCGVDTLCCNEFPSNQALFTCAFMYCNEGF